jgi:hypothetical protein
MKYLKYFENSEDQRSEIWEIDDQFFDLMDNEAYVLEMLKRVGMDDRNIQAFMQFNLKPIQENIEKVKDENKWNQEDKWKKHPIKKLYLYFKKVYDIDYVQGYQYFPIIRTKPWWEIPDDCEFKRTIKVEDWELKVNKYNI